VANFSASDVKSGSTADVNKIITYLEALGWSLDSNSGGALSSASSTLVTMATITRTVAADDLVLLIARIALSSTDGAASTARFEFQSGGGSLIADMIETSPISSAGGDSANILLFHALNPSAGSTQYDLKFSRNSGSGTIHSARSTLFLLTGKKKA